MSEKINVKFYNNISPIAMELLNKFPEFKETKGKGDIVIARSAELNGEKELKEISDAFMVCRAGIGVTNIPVAKLTNLNIPVMFAPGGNADSVAEEVMASFLDAAKNQTDSINFVKTFSGKTEELEKLKAKFKGVQLRGMTALVFGMGNIGSRVSYLLSKFGMKVIIATLPNECEETFLTKYLPTLGDSSMRILNKLKKKTKVSICKKLPTKLLMENGEIIITSDIENALKFADFITPHIGQQPKPLFGKELFSKVKKGVCIINADRGTLVDENELKSALDSGIVSSYHSDFCPEKLELRKHKKVFSTPHIAASTESAEDNCAIMVVNEILDYTFDGNVVNSKNFPGLYKKRVGETRICVASQKEAKIGLNMVEQCLKKMNYTIEQTGIAENKSVCYIVVDLKQKIEGEEKKKIIKEIEKFAKKGKIKCRCLKRNKDYDNRTSSSSIEKKQPVLNFNAGPAILPKSVIDGMKESLGDFKKSGMNIVEMSHRGKEIMDMVKETEDLIKKLLNVPKGFKVLFLGGGATLQWSMIPMNLSKKGDKIGYIETGTWSKKACEDAKVLSSYGFGTPVVVASNKDNKEKAMPKNFKISQDLKYLHITFNETIHGLEWAELPNSGKVPLIIDASSNIFSRKIDWKRNIGLVYAGAQKNSGIAGSTIVIIREDLIDKKVVLPSYLKYAGHAEEGSLMNTPPVLAIYSVNLMMKWLQKEGGVDNMIELSKKKSKLIYDTLEGSKGFYVGRVSNKDDRSKMNITWNLKNEDLEKKFLAEAQKIGLIGLAGHRSLGGVRASIYNGMNVEGVTKLIEFMKKFQTK